VNGHEQFRLEKGSTAHFELTIRQRKQLPKLY